MQSTSSALLSGAIVTILSLGACGSGTGPTVSLGTEFLLAPTQSATLAGTDLAVRVDSVTADTRCPMGVLCIVAGDANIYLSVLRGKRMPTPTLFHVSSAPASVANGAELIELVALEPFRRLQVDIKPEEYRVRLIVRSRT